MEKIQYYDRILSQELRLLERTIYKFKNQHGRLRYFEGVFRVSKELKVFLRAFRETFFNKASTENPDTYYHNLKDVRRISRRIKWDLKDAGVSISRLLAHGFFLPLVFLLFSTFSRMFSVIINFQVTVDSFISQLSDEPKATATEIPPSSKNVRKERDHSKKNNSKDNLNMFDNNFVSESDDDFGELVTYDEVYPNNRDSISRSNPQVLSNNTSEIFELGHKATDGSILSNIVDTQITDYNTTLPNTKAKSYECKHTSDNKKDNSRKSRAPRNPNSRSRFYSAWRRHKLLRRKIKRRPF
ncbi:U4 U6 small nuclear ribonucleoprotein PRP31 [Cryptosporidium felis]|nr:U4 U6 small nuclear ribonucleoprotein PRP31 [Cryptosporidium felis]